MSQNPYAQFGQQGGQFGREDLEPLTSRTSIMAVMSLVLGIIAVIPGVCCIPGPGAVAVILGGLAALFIGRSMGRLSGMGLAITGIVLGLLASVFSVFVLIGASNANKELGGQFFKPAAQTFKKLDSGDIAGFRGSLTPAAAAKLTDEQITDFVARYQTEVGSFQKAPEDLIEMVSAFMKMASNQNQAATNQRIGQQSQNFIPMPSEFSRGNAVILMLFDPQAMTKMGSGATPGTLGPIAVNFCVLTMDGKEVWLWDEAESRKLMSGPGMPPSPATPPSGALPGGAQPGPDASSGPEAAPTPPAAPEPKPAP